MTTQPPTPTATRRELQIIEASRRIRAGETVVVGAGLPYAVAALAQQLHAPTASFIFDSGLIDPVLTTAPVSVGDPVMRRATAMTSMDDVFLSLLQAGRVDTGMLSAAQIDRFGNVNSSYVDGADGRRRRLPGAGGANAIASAVRRLLIVMPHEARRFVARCDYVSSPGFVDADGRVHAGLRRGLEEICVVTDECVLRATPGAPQLAVVALMPGIALADVVRSTGCSLPPGDSPPVVAAATVPEVATLRDRVDPHRNYLPPA